MKRLRKLLFLILFLVYSAGVLLGALKEVNMKNAAEMYEYLEKGISGYDTAAKSGIITAAKDNLKIFALLLAGSLFKPLIWLSAAAMLLKGYLSGFSIMAALRLYGIKGMSICIPNLISAAVLIPASIYYGGTNISGLLDRYEKGTFYKRFLWATIFLLTIFCADALIKGSLSAIFVKWASRLINAG